MRRGRSTKGRGAREGEEHERERSTRWKAKEQATHWIYRPTTILADLAPSKVL